MLKYLDRYIFREIAVSWSAVTVVLLVIMVANVLARILGKVTDGSVAPEMLLVLVGVKAISLLVTLIPLGLYLGVMLALGRLYRDSEMSALSACGVGLKSIYRPVLLNGLIGVLLITVLTFWASPWAARFERSLTDRIATQSVTSLLTPGRFTEILNGSAVVFSESSSNDKRMFNNVFVHRGFEDGSFEVEIARSADYQVDEQTGAEFIVFSDGVSTAAVPDENRFRITEFERHGIRLPEQSEPLKSDRVSARSLMELWDKADNPSIAELQWRISIPLAALLLSLMAVPLAHTTPRQGRYSRVAFGILFYIPYANLLVLSRKWLAAGTISPWLGLWWVHVLAVLLIVVLTIRQHGIGWFRELISNRKLAV